MPPRCLALLLAAIAPLLGCAAQPAPDTGRAGATVAATADPASIRAQLQSLLREMTDAVNAADQPRYLACVDLRDPCFGTEQRNWAKDLERKRPEKFEARLAEDDAELSPARDGSVAAKVLFTWQMPGGKERTLTFPARFVKGEKGLLYAGEDWRTLEAPGVRVSFLEGSEDSAKAVAEVLPSVRAHVHGVFGLEGDKDLTERTQQVKLYKSMKHLQQSIYLSYSDGLAGWNEPGESIKLMAMGAGRGPVRTLLAHEYGHVATFQLGPKANDMPWWILEGVAELSAEHYSHNQGSVDKRVRQWSESGKLVDWDKLADFHGEAVQHMAQVYTQGHHMVSYISERFGQDKRNAWMRAMSVSNSKSLDEATREVLALPFADLDAQWRASLKEPKPEKESPAGPG